MTLPNKWGQGQLFVFSALDGESYLENDLVGTLCGDKLGVRFQLKTARELVVSKLPWGKVEMETVTSDLIRVQTKLGNIAIVFAERHAVIGYAPVATVVSLLVEGEHTVTVVDGVAVHDTGDGQFTAFLRSQERFAFAYGSTQEEAVEMAKRGIAMDPEVEIPKKLAIYQKFPPVGPEKYAMLYSKCLSVMKSQLYSPEGRFQRIWSTPDRLPHKYLWLWDSVFHSVGYRNIDAALAQDLILDVLDGQRADGFIPHMITTTDTSNVTQPPVIGWGAWTVYEKSGDKEFLKTVFDANKRFLLWCRENRRDTDEELYTWFTEEYAYCRCGESGMDNSPRFDKDTRLQAIDLSCFMANETRVMANIAKELGDGEEEAFFAAWHQTIKEAVCTKLWCAEDGFFYDYDQPNGQIHKISSVASFLPLFAGICTPEQAQALVSHLCDPEDYGTTCPVPCISRKDPTYGDDMWRGPVWMNYNYMIMVGLRAYGYQDLADEIRNKTLDMVLEWYNRKGVVYEFYDAEGRLAPNELNRKGPVYEPYDFNVRYQSVRDYGWSCTLTVDMLHHYGA